MIKIIYRFFLFIILLFVLSITYLSTIGIKTEKFNSNISKQIKKIDENLDIRLKKISIILNPFKFTIKTKTIGTDLVYRDKIIQLESIRSNISIKSLLNNRFSLTKVNISTKSLNIKNVISFIRLFKNDPKIYIAEKLIKNGFVIADIEIEFDDLGKIKNNYKVNGLVKDGKIDIFKKYNFNKINFFFNIEDKKFELIDSKLSINNKFFVLPEFIINVINDEYSVSGKINNENISLNKNDIRKLLNIPQVSLEIQEITFNSKNNFKFDIGKNYKISNLNIESEIYLDNLDLKSDIKLKKIFSKIKDNISFKKHKVRASYKKNNLDISGSGDVFLQDYPDKIKYKIYKNKDNITYDANLIIKNNLFGLELLNYEKRKKSKLELRAKIRKNNKKNLIFDEIYLKEENNIFSLENLFLSEDFKIIDFGDIIFDYFDKENIQNKIKVTKSNQNYLVKGKSFNINYIIEKILNSNNKSKFELFNKDFKFDFDINKIYLNNNDNISDLTGHLLFSNNKIKKLVLESKFSNQKNIKFTINTNENEQITTIFSDKAKPLVDRYKFIKGFSEGYLDFYSVKKNNQTQSILKINDFKLKELPALTKILTLASLQGIADLLSGEGIRFNEFEMRFSNKDKLMQIEEIYAIGPAISILMSGYIEKDKLISLRGTLVPATTINKTIGSIPILGNILVGKKVGEGVFGVSFKVKGPSKNLETTVNPIKTLTPRFITRTLEKIKKN
jgi:hypothetical protein